MGSNKGVAFARNKGLEKSSGRYVTFWTPMICGIKISCKPP